ncbi:MAG: MFS transporter [Lachnospiraceae bacterium]|nr:MFS transporter [Lachnospiraceae bacterium]
MKFNRQVYAVIGVVILLLAGLVYAWSVLALPIGAYFVDWSKAQLSLTFTICMMSFCVGCMTGGLTDGKINVKQNIWTSGILFFAGFFTASCAQTPITLYLGYGVCCGFASGFVYNAVLSTMSAWYSDKQGLISGVLLMGFGMSSFLVGKVYQAVTPSGEGVDAWRKSFRGFGILLLVILAVCGYFFTKPTKEDLEAQGIDAGVKKKKASGGLEINARQMIARPSFWLFFLWTICIGGAGMALISQASGIAREVGSEVEAGMIATVVGLISVFNGLGRVFFGNLFDKKGRTVTMMTVDIAFALSSALLVAALTGKMFALIIAGFVCCGFSYGGLNPSISAFVNASYGGKNYPINFSVMNLNLLIASFGGTIGGLLFDISGSYMTTLFYMIGSGVVSLIFTLSIRKL